MTTKISSIYYIVESSGPVSHWLDEDFEPFNYWTGTITTDDPQHVIEWFSKTFNDETLCKYSFNSGNPLIYFTITNDSDMVLLKLKFGGTNG